jgi:hypothetical protein
MYLEDLVAQIDAPRLLGVRTSLAQLDFLRLPQLFLFIGRSQNLRFRRVEVVFYSDGEGTGELNIELRVDRCLSESTRPYLSLYTSFEWSGTHLTHIAHVLDQIFKCAPGAWIISTSKPVKTILLGTAISTVPNGRHSSAYLPLWRRCISLGHLQGRLLVHLKMSLRRWSPKCCHPYTCLYDKTPSRKSQHPLSGSSFCASFMGVP